MLRVAVFVSGGGTNLQAIIDGIHNDEIRNAKIELVVSDKENAYALNRAKDNHILAMYISPKDFSTTELYQDALLNILSLNQIDLIVLAGYLKIIPQGITRAYKNRIINVHPSLIPSFCGSGYYGLHVHEGVLNRGVKITGATVHFVDEGTDTGPIILQKAVFVKDDDTKETLQKRVMEEAEWIILPQAIDLIANNKVRIVENRVYIKE